MKIEISNSSWWENFRVKSQNKDLKMEKGAWCVHVIAEVNVRDGENALTIIQMFAF